MRFLMLFFLCFFLACSSKNKQFMQNQAQFELKQNAKFYAFLEFEQNLSLLSPFQAPSFKLQAQNYKDKFFYPWHAKLDDINLKELFWSFDLYLNKDKNYYFFNKQSIEKSYFESLIANANTKDFLKLAQKALVIENAQLKNIPTQKALLLNPFNQGEGLPFDYALDSVLNVGSAVLISHLTEDKQYAFVLSEAGWGFVEYKYLLKLSDKEAKAYENLSFITPLKERVQIKDEKGNFAFEARIGALYAYYGQNEKYFLSKIGSKKLLFPKEQMAEFPLEFNDENIKIILNALFGLAYGWGGYDFERDCSLFIRDFFTPFGIHLPRNSQAQSLAFIHFDLSFLNNTQKENFIKEFAKPYESLLGLKGHIMLYVGELEDKAVALHSAWGIRTKDNQRLLLSQNVLSSLVIGQNDFRVAKKDLFLSKINTLSFLRLSPEEEQHIKQALEKLKS